jgi:hypothetical protein
MTRGLKGYEELRNFITGYPSFIAELRQSP